jgi:hypothetical protein
MEENHHDPVQSLAVQRIVATRDSLVEEQKRVRQEQRRLSELDRELERKLGDCFAAARFFGVDISLPVDDEAIAEAQRRVRTYEMRLRSSETDEERTRAFEFLNRARARLADLTGKKEAEERSAKDQGPVVGPDDPSETAGTKAPKVREVALDRLQASGDRGQKAADIRKFVEQAYPVKLHEKTVGMTLYRLSKENLVHRKGQVWFYGPQAEQTLSVEPEDPGAAAPGNTQDHQ